MTREDVVGLLKAKGRALPTDMRGLDLRNLDFSGRDLPNTKFAGSSLWSADFSEAYLYSADFSGADLSYARFYRANAARASFRGANIRHAVFTEASLIGADLTGVKYPGSLAATEILPREGAVVGWKKCRDGVIVKLRVPAEARRSNATGRKCRAEFVEVLEVVGAEVGVSNSDHNLLYTAGKRVTADHWDEERYRECAGGIHFFLTREEAQDYDFS